MRGYYLECIHPRWRSYRIIVINNYGELHTYITTVALGSNIRDQFPSYIDLGGII